MESFYGDTPEIDRQDIVIRFQDRKTLCVFFIGILEQVDMVSLLLLAITVVYYSIAMI